MQRTIFPTFILLTLLAISLLVLIKLQTNNPYTQTIYNAQEYMHSINLKSYDEHGILKNAIIAQSWQFFPEHKYSVIKQPNVTIYKPTGYIYNITADLGHLVHQHKSLSNKIELIKLSHNVGVKQNHPYKEKSGFNLITSYLEFNPTTELATTNKEVTITKIGLLITGTGMAADLKHNQLELHNNVKTKYTELK